MTTTTTTMTATTTALKPTFVTAGNATFTIEMSAAFVAAERTPAHYTYKVKHKAADAKGGEAWFVSLLTGPDNTADYSYLGMLSAATGEVRLTRASRFADDSHPVKILRRVLARMWKNELDRVEAAGWKVHHEGRCGCCGRKLTTPESVETGIGPVCAERAAA